MTKHLILIALLFSNAAAAACAPTAATSEQAICLARKSIERSNPEWQVVYTAKEEETHWVVHYAPISPQVRGGVGDLKVDKKSGQVAFEKGEK